MQLLSPQVPAGSVLVWHQGKAVSRAQFARAAQQLAERLPASDYFINLCAERLSFMLGLAAAGLRQGITLLPHNQSSMALAELKDRHPNHHVLDDQCLAGIDWFSATTRPNTELEVPGSETAAILYTSGSTGEPQPQAKTWASLLRTGELDAECFLQTSGITLVATVPSQHMFGLQTTVLMPLRGDCALHDSRPFYPADIRHALDSVPAPRALILTPTHLRACLNSGLTLPALEFILSATAPLTTDLAAQAEARWQAPVLEIYGSTEAGTMATRRTAHESDWTLLPTATWREQAQELQFHAPHLPQPVTMSDCIEAVTASTFQLLGRNSDFIKIGGKRASLGELTAALLRVPGVMDGVVFMPAGRERTVALAVAPGQLTAQILDHMAGLVDAVFLPRPLRLVERLPRNSVGKLDRAALEQLFKDAAEGSIS